MNQKEDSTNNSDVSMPVGIVTLNGLDVLKTCMRSWLSLPNAMLFIFDNGSDAETVEFLKTTCEKEGNIKHLHLSNENKGLPFGRNHLIREISKTTKGEYLMLIDSDIELYPVCIPWLKQTLDADRLCGMAGFIEANAGDFPVTPEGHIEEITNECLMYRRIMFNEIGMFSQAFKYYCSDSHFSTKANMHGWKTRVINGKGYNHYKHTSQLTDGVLDLRAKDQEKWMDWNKKYDSYWSQRFVCGKGEWPRNLDKKRFCKNVIRISRVFGELNKDI